MRPDDYARDAGAGAKGNDAKRLRALQPSLTRLWEGDAIDASSAPHWLLDRGVVTEGVELQVETAITVCPAWQLLLSPRPSKCPISCDTTHFLKSSLQSAVGLPFKQWDTVFPNAACAVASSIG
jgi:hypothetical protein